MIEGLGNNVSAIMKAIIVTTCTNRKRRPALEALRARNLPLGSIEQVASDWVGRVSSARDLCYPEQVYCGRSYVEAINASKVIGAPLYVISAGLGLVPPLWQIPAYDLTTTKSSKDRIQSRITETIGDADWWNQIGIARGNENPITELVREHPDQVIIIGVSSGYLELIRDDLGSLNDCELQRVRIVGIRPSNDVPHDLANLIMPYDERLDGPDTPNPGTRGDFAQRALHHFCCLILETGNQEGDQIAHAEMVRESLEGKRPPVHITRKSISDVDLINLVPHLWGRANGQSSKMLRILRDEELIACEQGRFASLFKQAKEVHGLL